MPEQVICPVCGSQVLGDRPAILVSAEKRVYHAACYHARDASRIACAICWRELRPGEPVGNVHRRPAHLDCWIRWRAQERPRSAA